VFWLSFILYLCLQQTTGMPHLKVTNTLFYKQGHQQILFLAAFFEVQKFFCFWIQLSATQLDYFNGITLVNNQIDALLLMYLFHFSTCFEQPSAHHQENQLYQYIIWYISLCVGDCLVCLYTYQHHCNNNNNNIICLCRWIFSSVRNFLSYSDFVQSFAGYIFFLADIGKCAKRSAFEITSFGRGPGFDSTQPIISREISTTPQNHSLPFRGAQRL
jgi:hypothetical protein